MKGKRVVIWQGTVGTRISCEQPMRITENEDGKLMTEFAYSVESEEGEITFDDSQWLASYEMIFQLMNPAPSEELIARMVADGLVEA